jgi:predicted enzyme related to lactoylglutathione lyase
VPESKEANMTERDRYPAGVPCWVETLQPDVQAALAFYGPLFQWEFAGPGAMPGDPPGQYFVARVRGRDVAGIGSSPGPTSPPAATWGTYIRVESADETAETARDVGGAILADPFDAPPAGRMAMLADPVGAMFGVWEAGAREGAQLVDEPRVWAMSSLHTTDTESSKAFYGSVFGWQHEPFGGTGTTITLWRLPGYVGGTPQQPVPRDVVGVMTPIEGRGSSPIPPHWSVNFWVDDADATTEQAIGLGGRAIQPPSDAPGFRNAVLADPQGAVFSISQRTGRR